MRVRDFMIQDVIHVKKGDTVRHLLQTLVNNRIGGVPVVDEEDRLMGMVSDGDILRILAPREQTLASVYVLVFTIQRREMSDVVYEHLDQSIEELMTKRKIYYLHPDDDLEEAFNILSKHHFKKIPVVNDDDRVVGVISRGDMIRYITTEVIKEE